MRSVDQAISRSTECVTESMDIVKRNWEIFLNMKQSQHIENTVQQIL